MATANGKVRPNRLLATLAAVLAAGVAACSNSNNGGGPAQPTLQGVAVTGAAYVAVGSPQQFTATGTYSDGAKAALTSGLTWASSNALVATVDASGLVTPIAAGTTTITATHASGASGNASVTSRVLVSIGGGALPAQASVGATTGYYRLTGLTPGAVYAPTLGKLTDDVDLAVYGDASLADGARLCNSAFAGKDPESCVAKANAAGELWLVVDGQFTDAGATFEVSAPGAEPLKLDGTLAFPGGFPSTGSIGVTEELHKVTGLTAGASYEVRISKLSDDIDVEVYADGYQYTSLCASYNSGTVDDFCTAKANAAGELFVEIDGECTSNGGNYTLTLTKQ